jgi:cytochrome c oxidase assembly protein subunit 15
MASPYLFGQRLLHLWALLTAAAALLLLVSGGVVTSKGVGMAVPDWPTTFGMNMFLFPVSQWIGGIFYEHSHRLIASGVGLMTLLLTALAFVVEPRRGVKTLAVCLAVAVVVQGLFGGLRVVLNKDDIGIAHAMLAQSFFSALCVFCVITGRSFVEGRWVDFEPDSGPARVAIVMTALIFVQLGLGATMRHEHIGLAVPDFPLAYGQILPDTSPAAIEAINARRAIEGNVPIRASFVWVHLVHRAMAVVVVGAVFFLFWRTRRCAAGVRRMAALGGVLIVLQFVLGAATVLSGKAEEIATAHMALGALLLAWAVLLAFRLVLGGRRERFRIHDLPQREGIPA